MDSFKGIIEIFEILASGGGRMQWYRDVNPLLCKGALRIDIVIKDVYNGDVTVLHECLGIAVSMMGIDINGQDTIVLFDVGVIQMFIIGNADIVVDAESFGRIRTGMVIAAR